MKKYQGKKETEEAEVVEKKIVKEEKKEKKPIEGWQKNAVHSLEIEGYTAEGAGVARLDGRVVFVPHTIRGEIWDVTLVKANKNFAFGRGTTCTTGSPARVEKDCQFRGKCGGCQFRHMNYEEELFAKFQQVESAMTRIAGVQDVEISPVLGAEESNRYRNKVQFPVSGSQEWVKIGFFRPRSHDVLDVKDCLLQPEDASIAREVVKKWMMEFNVNPYDESNGTGIVRHLYMRNNAKGESLLCLVVAKEKVKNTLELSEALQAALPSLKGFLLNINKKDTNVVLSNRYSKIWGEDFLYEELYDLSFKLSVPSFFQVNYSQTKVLYSKVLEFARLTGSETVLDLYCGIGTIALIMAKNAKKVLGAEIIEEAVEDAKENAQRNNIDNAEFFQGDCAEVVNKFLEDGITPDVVVLDPPRKGLSAEVPELLSQLKPSKIIYVSCDPATLGRDVKKFVELGYCVKNIQPVDLFPRTKHVECVVLLEK